MFGEFQVGESYPRPEDVPRIERYDQARVLFEGAHQNSVMAKRIKDKLAASHQFTEWNGYSSEGVVWFTFNLPRLIVQKFADLQVLNTPVILTERDAFEDDLLADVPDLWARIHYAKQMQRTFGDVGLSLLREADNGPVDMRVVDPSRWFPVLDPNDHMTVEAHQVAWLEQHNDGKGERDYVRVDICYPDRMERRAFLLAATSKEEQKTHEIEKAVPLGKFWGELEEVVPIKTGDMPTFVHMSNGWLEPDMIFGRPEFHDSAGLVDNVSWRLSTWSDANDNVSHAPEAVPTEWLTQDEEGTVLMPSRYHRRFVGKSGRTADVIEPKYMQYPLDHETLKDEFEASVRALLVRHEMAPALLGIETGRERESGEAKALGMGTTEAATRRDLLQTRPKVDRALTILARLKGDVGAEVQTHWRVGLPKSQDELLMEMQTIRSLGLMTRKDMLEHLYPWLDDKQIEEKLAELDEERQAEVEMYDTDSTAEQG